MLITYAQYQSRGGALTEDEFKVYEPKAEVYLNHWTLNRLKSSQVVKDLKAQDQYESVLAVMVSLIDGLPTVEKQEQAIAEGSKLTSFNNGVNSFSYASGDSSETTEAERLLYQTCVRYLPVELISADVTYNHAG